MWPSQSVLLLSKVLYPSPSPLSAVSPSPHPTEKVNLLQRDVLRHSVLTTPRTDIPSLSLSSLLSLSPLYPSSIHLFNFNINFNFNFVRTTEGRMTRSGHDERTDETAMHSHVSHPSSISLVPPRSSPLSPHPSLPLTPHSPVSFIYLFSGSSTCI